MLICLLTACVNLVGCGSTTQDEVITLSDNNTANAQYTDVTYELSNLSNTIATTTYSTTAKTTTATTETSSIITTTTTTTEKVLELSDRELNIINNVSDAKGWVKIDTFIDYPIMQSTDNDYYLDHSFDGKLNSSGSIFFDYANTVDWENPYENFVIYGHNMADGQMFGTLSKYRVDPTFYKKSPFIELSSGDKTYTYVIFAEDITSGNSDTDWNYWNMTDLSDKDTYDYYVSTAKNKSLADIPVNVKYGDKLITLSTCYLDSDNSRFVIVARQLRDGETRESIIKNFQSTI